MTAPGFSEAEVVADFGDALTAAGFRLRGLPLMDGGWHRAPVEGDRGRDTSGGYRGHLDGIRPAGSFLNFRTGHKGKWSSGTPLPAMSGAERAAAQRKVDADRERRDRQRAAQAEAIARRCAATWEDARPAPEDHPYLRRKGVSAAGLRLARDGRLLVPLYDFAGQLRLLQRIAPNGKKLFPEGSRLDGLHLLLGELHGDGPLLIAEGWVLICTES